MLDNPPPFPVSHFLHVRLSETRQATAEPEMGGSAELLPKLLGGPFDCRAKPA